MNKIKIYYNVSSELQQREYLEGNVIIKDQCLEVNAATEKSRCFNFTIRTRVTLAGTSF